MKKFTVAIPVAIALLTFGLAGKSMAADVVIPIAHGDATAVGVNDTLNGNKLLNDTVEGKAAANDQSIAVSDSLNGNQDAEAEVEHGNGNAVAGIGDAVVDKSINISDIRVAIANSELDGEVSHNRISFGNGLEQEAKGNKGGDATNVTLASQKNKQANGALGANGALQGNGALQASGAIQGNGADQDRTAVSALLGDEAEANGLDKAIGKNKSEAANLAVGVNKAKGENEADQKNTGDQANTITPTADANTGAYSATQTQTVSLATGANTISGSIHADGINYIPMSTGINNLFQNSVNVQATATINP